jgi:hypothetical protein
MKRTTRRKSDQTAGKDSTRISTTIPLAVDAELCRLATASGQTRSGMARECIKDAVTRGLTITTQKSHAGKVISYPTTHPANPTARAADNVGT